MARRSKRSLRARLLIAACLLLLAAALIETLSLTFWVSQVGWTFQQQKLVNKFFVYRKTIEKDPPTLDDGRFDVLTLGGSVWHPDFGQMEKALHEALEAECPVPFKIHNPSYPGYRSLDSRKLYESVAHMPFDLVIVYHGINDVSMNNCPPEVFQDDYSHARRYLHMKILERYPRRRWFTLPYTIDYLRDKFAAEFSDQFVVPMVNDWAKYGGNIRTPGPFREHFERIATVAAERGQPLLLMTFAYYVAPGYSDEKLEAGGILDYTMSDDHTADRTPISNWGLPQHVPATIDAHNQVIREVAQKHQTLFVDQDALIAKRGENFVDICHLSWVGDQRFVENMMRQIRPLLEAAAQQQTAAAQP